MAKEGSTRYNHAARLRERRVPSDRQAARDARTKDVRGAAPRALPRVHYTVQCRPEPAERPPVTTLSAGRGVPAPKRSPLLYLSAMSAASSSLPRDPDEALRFGLRTIEAAYEEKTRHLDHEL